MRRLLLLCALLLAVRADAQFIGGGATGGGSGTVTRVDASVPSLMTISGNPITTTGTLAFGFANQSGNCFIASPLDGTSGALTCRVIGIADIPNGTITLAKQANMATASVVYRKTAGSGAPEVQTLATLKTDLGLAGTNSGDQTITITGDISGSGTAAITATLPNIIAPSTQPKITYNAKGQVTAGAPLVSGDIPSNAANTSGTAAAWTIARNLAGNSVDGSANVAFANKFVVQGTSDTGLSAAQFLGALGTGIVKNTTTTGLLSIAIAADFPTFNQNTTGTAGGLSGSALGGDVTNSGNTVTLATIGVSKGGTGQTTYTKGDLLTAPGGASLNKLGVGTDGQVFTADSASTNGVKWASAAGGSPPFTDDATAALVKGTADATKLFGINVAAVTTGNHPVLTIGGTTAAPTMVWPGTISTIQFSGSERFGASSTCGNHVNCTAIGSSSSGTADGSTAIGQNTSAAQQSVAIGAGAAAGGGSGTALGAGTSAPGQGTIALGCSAAGQSSHYMVVGGSTGASCNITDVFLGSGVNENASPMVTIHATGGTGTNSAGADIGIDGGYSTGNAKAGSVRIQTATPVASGSGFGSQVDRFVVRGGPISLTSGAAAVVDDVQLPTLAMTGGKIIWTIICTDGTDMQSVSGEVVFSAVNKGGTYTTDIETVSSVTPSDAITPVVGWAKAVSSGTLTTAWTVVTGTNKIQVKVTSTTSLTATSFKLYATITNNSEQALN